MRALGCAWIRFQGDANREGGSSHEADHLHRADTDAGKRIQDPANHHCCEHTKVGLYVEINGQRPRCMSRYGNGVRGETR